MFTFSNFQFIPNCQKLWHFSPFYCCIRLASHMRYLYRFYHSRATRKWSVCNEMYHNVSRYEYRYLTFQTQIHLHKQYVFETNIIQSEYAFLFPFSMVCTQKLLGAFITDYIKQREQRWPSG